MDLLRYYNTMNVIIQSTYNLRPFTTKSTSSTGLKAVKVWKKQMIKWRQKKRLQVKKCSSLKEGRELCNKVKNHSTMVASNEVSDRHSRTKNLNLKALEDRFNEVNAESEAVKQEHEELQKEIQDLQEKSVAAEAISQQNGTIQMEILGLKERHEHVKACDQSTI